MSVKNLDKILFGIGVIVVLSSIAFAMQVTRTDMAQEAPSTFVLREVTATPPEPTPSVAEQINAAMGIDAYHVAERLLAAGADLTEVCAALHQGPTVRFAPCEPRFTIAP